MTQKRQKLGGQSWPVKPAVGALPGCLRGSLLTLPAESAACALRNLQLPPGSPFRDPGRSRIDFVMFALHACERQTRRDLPSAGSFCQCVPLQGWLWQSLGAQSSIQVSCLGGSAASIRATLCCFPAHVSRKLDWKQSVWRLNWR